MKRWVEREWLDDLPGGDLRARGSRRDLRLLNAWMGHPAILARHLRSVPTGNQPKRLVELGAGDGTFLLHVGRRLGSSWRGTRALLVDVHNLISADTMRAFDQLGWSVQLWQGDVFEWGRKAGQHHFEVVLANLFLHHFVTKELGELLRMIQQHCDRFIALEPRRSRLSLVFSHLVGLIGCNAVTRHDAPVSVRAGFQGRELWQLWHGNGDWLAREKAAGPFSHLFLAERKKAAYSSTAS